VTPTPTSRRLTTRLLCATAFHAKERRPVAIAALLLVAHCESNTFVESRWRPTAPTRV